MTKKQIVLAAIHAYADPFDPDNVTIGSEVVDKTIQFLETFAGLNLETCATPGGKSYEFAWILSTLRQMYGEELPAEAAITFLIELDLIRTDLIDFGESPKEEPSKNKQHDLFGEVAAT